MTDLPLEHQLNRLIFVGINAFMQTAAVPSRSRHDQFVPIPYLYEVGDTRIVAINLYRRTRARGGASLVVQYSVKIGNDVIATLERNPQEPIYGVFRYRREHLAADLETLAARLSGPLKFREMTREEAEKFVVDDKGLTKKKIRVLPPAT